MRYWINTVTRDHVLTGRGGGFLQANHGEKSTLEQLKKGDYIVFYSPRTKYRDGEKLQTFTAICEVTGTDPYQVETGSDFKPWRLDVSYLDVTEAEIEPLLDKLEFIDDTQNWGLPFRRGLFEISQADFKIIAAAMNVNSEETK